MKTVYCVDRDKAKTDLRGGFTKTKWKNGSGNRENLHKINQKSKNHNENF